MIPRENVIIYKQIRLKVQRQDGEGEEKGTQRNRVDRDSQRGVLSRGVCTVRGTWGRTVVSGTDRRTITADHIAVGIQVRASGVSRQRRQVIVVLEIQLSSQGSRTLRDPLMDGGGAVAQQTFLEILKGKGGLGSRRSAGDLTCPDNVLLQHLGPGLETRVDDRRLKEALDDRLQGVFELVLVIRIVQEHGHQWTWGSRTRVVFIGYRAQACVFDAIAIGLIKVVGDQGPLLGLQVLVQIVIAGLVPESVPGANEEIDGHVDQGMLGAIDQVCNAARMLSVRRVLGIHLA